MSARSLISIGITELLPSELETPTLEAWERALAHAEAKARSLAASVREELGPVTAIEEIAEAAQYSSPVLRLRVTFDLAAANSPAEPTSSTAGIAGPPDDILDHVGEELKPLYRQFREAVLAIRPDMTSAPAPLRNGKRRYEGFRIGGSHNVIVAGFRRDSVRLQFQVPKGALVPSEERVRHGNRDWHLVKLSSATQLEGAIALARETVGGPRT